MAARGRMILGYMGRLCSKTSSSSSSSSSSNITTAFALPHHYRFILVNFGATATTTAPLPDPTTPHTTPAPRIDHNGWRLPQTRSMSCCAGTGSPPPREIIVEYCESSYTDDFIKLANEIEEAFPEFLVSGNPDGAVKPREGAFEITSGDSVLFSKLKANRMPALEEVLKAIDSLPPAQCPL